MTVHSIVPFLHLRELRCACDLEGSSCLRSFGHWGPHLTVSKVGTFALWQTDWLRWHANQREGVQQVPTTFSFTIDAIIAFRAMSENNWSWEE